MVSPREITIMIVDDDVDLLNSIATSFRLFHFNVVEKTNGNDAIDYLKQNDDVNLIVSDIRMPNGGGIDLLKFVKDRNTRRPKVLFISGYSDYTIDEMYSFGVDGFFSKPFRISSIKDAITRTLLDLNDRWSKAPAGHLTMMVNKTIESFDETEKNKTLMIGRGGFFVAMNSQLPEENDLVSFEIKVKSGVPVAKVSGQGRIKWSRSENTDTGLAGVGIEIEHLEEDCRARYVDWLNKRKIVSYIPN